MQSVITELSTLISIGLVQMLAVISPGPSFLVTARTAVAKSRFDGVKVGLGIGAGTVICHAAKRCAVVDDGCVDRAGNL